jgi:site-specific DNA recombinase
MTFWPLRKKAKKPKKGNQKKMKTTSSPKAVGYVRVSSEDQVKEGVSLENQKSKIKAYCNLKDLDLIAIMEDPGVSARNLNRPGVKQVLELAERKRAGAVVVYKLDRMFRSTVDALETTRRFEELGVAFHSIEETIDTKSAMGRFFFTLIAALAEMERGLIGERTKAALQHKKRNGDVWGPIPYGYKRNIDKILPDETEQTLIQEIDQLRQSGTSYSEIARCLNGRGVKTKKGRRWYPQTVKNAAGQKSAQII